MHIGAGIQHDEILEPPLSAFDALCQTNYMTLPSSRRRYSIEWRGDLESFASRVLRKITGSMIEKYAHRLMQSCVMVMHAEL